MTTDSTYAVLADPEAEAKVIAALLVDNALLDRLDLTADDFVQTAHARIFTLASGMIRRGNPATVAVLASIPETRAVVMALRDNVPARVDVPHLVGVIRTFSLRRHLLKLAEELGQRASEDIERSPEEIAVEFASAMTNLPSRKTVKTERQGVEEVLADLQRPVEMAPTGLRQLDIAIGGGLMAGHLYGIAARKKLGKTALMATISHNLTRAGVPHLYVSLEMSDREIIQRNIARDLSFNSLQFRTRTKPHLEELVAQYAKTASETTYWEHRPGATFDEVRAVIGRARMLGIKGCFVDYLQLIQGKNTRDSEARHLDQVAQGLLDIAKRHGIWVVAAAQLNQEDNTRGGEGLRLACDMYFALHREKHDPAAWMEMQESRFTAYQDVGSATRPGFWLRANGPHFSDKQPFPDEWPRSPDGEEA
jgi:replicative DNA helicase